MNKFITIYELLGLIKDGKAPKRIKWEDYIFSFYNDDYLCKNEDFVKNRETNYLLCYLFSFPESPLNIKVEILEEDKPIIEKISRLNYQQIGTYQLDNNDTLGFIKALNEQLTKHGRKLNEIIDYINKEEADKR